LSELSTDNKSWVATALVAAAMGATIPETIISKLGVDIVTAALKSLTTELKVELVSVADDLQKSNKQDPGSFNKLFNSVYNDWQTAKDHGDKSTEMRKAKLLLALNGDLPSMNRK